MVGGMGEGAALELGHLEDHLRRTGQGIGRAQAPHEVSQAVGEAVDGVASAVRCVLVRRERHGGLLLVTGSDAGRVSMRTVTTTTPPPSSRNEGSPR